MKIFGIRSHSNNMFVGLVVVPSPLISNLYEISSLNIQSMIRRVNDRGRPVAAAAAYDWGAAATLVGLGRRGLGFTF